MMNGCICCTVRGDLIVALKNLYKRISKFDAVIIETTGLADPAPVAQTFIVDDDIAEMFSLDGIITVVDSKYILTRLDAEKPEGVENEALEQVAFADRILVNKIDLVDDKEIKNIESRLKSINPTAPIIRCQQSKVDPKELINIGAFSLSRITEMDPEFLKTDGEHEHDPSVTSLAFRFEGHLNLHLLENFIQVIRIDMGADLYRYKGVLNVAGMNEKFIFQGVGMMFAGGFTGHFWGDKEVRECRFVFIGKDLDKQRITDGFKACKCSSELRFKIDDEVFVKDEAENWWPATIVCTWDAGVPYGVQLEDAAKSQVQFITSGGGEDEDDEDDAPIEVQVDTDEYIKKRYTRTCKKVRTE